MVESGPVAAWVRRVARESTRIETVAYEDMGMEWFRGGCAAVSISLLRKAVRKRTERDGPRATSAVYLAARGVAAAEAARGGREGAADRFGRAAACAGFLTGG